MNSLQKSKLGAIIILLLAGLGIIIGIITSNNHILFGSSAFLIGMIAYCFYLGREQIKRKEENMRRKLK